ncbi:MAG: hypothetical protein M3Z06_04030, partial [Actinomycetota bacterium]|nr:hypothetical protein [Actinomycetota bacterium]
MKLELARVEARMRTPFVSGTGTLTARELLLVRLKGADGVSGYGEAAPLPGYDGVTLEDATAAVEDCREALAGADGAGAAERAALLAQCTR